MTYKSPFVGQKLPPINEPDDLGPYWDAVVANLVAMKLPRDEALLHCFRACESRNPYFLPSHDSLDEFTGVRACQDLLKYLTYEAVTRCRPGGKLRFSTPNEFRLGELTCEVFAKLSSLRDMIETVRHGLREVEIDSSRRKVIFGDSRKLDDFHYVDWEAGRLLSPEAPPPPNPELALAIDFIEATSRFDRQNNHVHFDERHLGALRGISALEGNRLWDGPLAMPDDWSLGGYTLGDYRRLYGFLNSLATLRFIVISRIMDSGRPFPFNSAAILTSKALLEEDIHRATDLSLDVIREIVRDLTFDPEQVKWTDVQYQPLVPVGEGQFLIAPAVVGASNSDRNLMVLINKLPWRMSWANSLKDGREDLMIKRIVPVAQGCGLSAKARLPLGRRQQLLSDMDLLLWREDGSPEVLAISLKWFYDPDSVQETAAQSKRYADGIIKLRQSAEWLSRNSADVARRHRLSLPASARVLPVLVTYLEEVMERVRCDDIPAVTLSFFLDALAASNGDLPSLWSVLLERSKVRVPEAGALEYDDFRLGSYTFRVPMLLHRGEIHG